MSVDVGAEVIRLRASLENEVSRSTSEIVASLRSLERTMSRTSREARQTGRGLNTLGRQARGASRDVRSLAASMLGLNAAMRIAKIDVGNGVTTIGGLVVVLGSLASILPAIVPLAAFVGALGASILSAIPPAVAVLGTLALAFSGVGDAVSALADGDLDKINEAMANLAPAGQAFAETLFGLEPVLNTLRGIAQQSLLPGLGAALKTLAEGLLSPIGQLVAVYGSELGQLAQRFADSLISPEALEFFRFLTGQAQGLQGFGTFTTDLVAGVAQLLQALQPLAEVGGQIFLDMAAAFREFSSTVDFNGIANYARELLPSVYAFFNSIAGAVENLVKGLAPVGAQALGFLTGFLNLLANVDTAAITGLFQALADDFGVLTGILGVLIEAFAPVIGVLARGFAEALLLLSPVIESTAIVLGDTLLALLTGLGPLLPQVTTFFSDLLYAILPLIPELGTALLDAVRGLLPELLSLLDALIPLVPPLLDLAINILPLLVPLFSNLVPVIESLEPAFDALATLLGGLADSLKTFDDYLNGAKYGSLSEVRADPNATFGGGFQSGFASILRPRRGDTGLSHAGGVSITNLGIGGGGSGYGSGDHQRGAAVDVAGPGMQAMAALTNMMGGFGELHGAGSNRHAHLVPPQFRGGDTGLSRVNAVSVAAGGGTMGGVTINVYPQTAFDAVSAVEQALDRVRNGLSERRSTRSF